ncbi:MAG TPA: hypothetical protein VIC54_11385 [Terriglobales bacterium]
MAWPAGWTVLTDQVDGGGDHLSLGYIVLGASPPTSYTWTNTGSGVSAGIIAYRNVASVYALSTLSSATAGFTPGTVGDPICTAGTGAAGVEQCGIIDGVISSTAAMVSYIAQTEPANIWFGFGADDSAAFRTMLSNAPCSTVGCRVDLGPYGYVLTQSYTLPPNRGIQFQGAGAGVPDTTNSFVNGNTPPNANTGSRLMFMTTSLTQAAITIGGMAGVTSVAAWDRLSDLSLLAGAGKNHDGGGNDGVDILNWQDATLNRVTIANFAGRGVYVDGITAGSNKDYIGVVGLDQVYTIWNGGAGRQIGSATAINNLETISDNYGISEGNGGPAVKLEGMPVSRAHISPYASTDTNQFQAFTDLANFMDALEKAIGTRVGGTSASTPAPAAVRWTITAAESHYLIQIADPSGSGVQPPIQHQIASSTAADFGAADAVNTYTLGVGETTRDIVDPGVVLGHQPLPAVGAVHYRRPDGTGAELQPRAVAGRRRGRHGRDGGVGSVWRRARGHRHPHRQQWRPDFGGLGSA